jgi:hypothetical protein
MSYALFGTHEDDAIEAAATLIRLRREAVRELLETNEKEEARRIWLMLEVAKKYVVQTISATESRVTGS